MKLLTPRARVSLLLPIALAAPVSAQQLIGYVNTRDASVTGASDVLDGHFVLTGSAAITAKDHTAPITLSRGGTVNVCQTSVVHLTESREVTVAAPLLFSLDRGAVEIQMNAAASDAIMTPDLRFTVRNTGPLDLRLRVSRNGDTCVENRGREAPTLAVSDPFGESMYEVPGGRHVLFEHGSVHEVVDNETTPCGCPDQKGMSLADAMLNAPVATPATKPAAASAPQPTVVAPPLEQLAVAVAAPVQAPAATVPPAAPKAAPPAPVPAAPVAPAVVKAPAPVVAQAPPPSAPAPVVVQAPAPVVQAAVVAPPPAAPKPVAPKPAPPAPVVVVEAPAAKPAPAPAPVVTKAPVVVVAPPAATRPAPVVVVPAAPPVEQAAAVPTEESVEQVAAIAAARAAALHPFPAAVSEGLAPVPETMPAAPGNAPVQITDTISYVAPASAPAASAAAPAPAPAPAAAGKKAKRDKSSAAAQPAASPDQSSSPDLAHLIANFFRKIFRRN